MRTEVIIEDASKYTRTMSKPGAPFLQDKFRKYLFTGRIAPGEKVTLNTGFCRMEDSVVPVIGGKFKWQDPMIVIVPKVWSWKVRRKRGSAKASEKSYEMEFPTGKNIQPNGMAGISSGLN